MPVCDFVSAPLALITINRAARQRRQFSVEDLLSSIRRHGVLNPIIITRDHELVAGERRLEASRQLGLSTIPARFLDTLSSDEAFEIELEENVKRKDLTWQEIGKSIFELHRRYSAREPDWSQLQTAEAVGLNPGHVSLYLRVARDLHDPKIASCNTVRAAWELLNRRDGRLADDAMSEILEAGEAVLAPREISPEPLVEPQGSRPLTLPEARPIPILCEDFLSWAPAYTGPKFNLIHCDFPYGVNAFSSGSNRQHGDVGYEDNPEIYWALVGCLCYNLDRLMAYSGHLLFWFSMNHYEQTLATFAERAPSLQFDPFPLIWHKTDNTGMIPDPNRGPRRVYETAFLASREDRKIVRVVANAYGAPVDKTHHPSAKPVPVLKHFLSMLVDEGTRLLDPTCGAGSALRAAECLGAKEVLGLEVDEEHCETARRALRTDRALRGVGR